jgi:hypothetical protein
MDWQPCIISATQQPASLAPRNRDLQLAVIDRHGAHILAFPCRRVEDGWVNAKTKKWIDVFPTHWREWRRSFLGDPPPIYTVLDGTPHALGLGCSADQLANALRVPLAAVGVRVIRRRRAITKSPFSQFQARGLSRRQYEAKAVEVAQIVDEVGTEFKA